MNVDVIIPFHRNDTYLRESVNSIYRSYGVRPKVILIDDRATDKDSPISDIRHDLLVKSHGVGYPKALRLGLSHITSEFFALQDSDDFSHPLRLFSQLKDIREMNADISICGLMRVNKSGNRYLLQSPQLLDKRAHKMSNLLGSYNSNSSWVCKSSLIQIAEFLPETYQAIDWATTLRLPISHSISIVPKRLYGYRQHKVQMTRSPQYLGNAFHEIYPLWQSLNHNLGLPNLNFHQASIVAAPWTQILNSELSANIDLRRLIIWVDSFFSIPYIRTSQDKFLLKVLLYKKILRLQHVFTRADKIRFLGAIYSA